MGGNPEVMVIVSSFSCRLKGEGRTDVRVGKGGEGGGRGSTVIVQVPPQKNKKKVEKTKMESGRCRYTYYSASKIHVKSVGCICWISDISDIGKKIVYQARK